MLVDWVVVEEVFVGRSWSIRIGRVAHSSCLEKYQKYGESRLEFVGILKDSVYEYEGCFNVLCCRQQPH